MCVYVYAYIHIGILVSIGTKPLFALVYICRLASSRAKLRSALTLCSLETSSLSSMCHDQTPTNELKKSEKNRNRHNPLFASLTLCALG